MSPDPHGSSSSTIVNGKAMDTAPVDSAVTAKYGATSSSLSTYIFITVLASDIGSDMVMLKYSISPASLNATDISGIVSISSSSSISSWSWSWSSSSIAFIASINVSSSSLVSSPSLLESDSSNTVLISSSSSSSGPSSAFSNSSNEMLLLLSVSNKHSASSGVMLSSSIFSIPTS